jgi:arylsulfatase A
MHWPTSIPAGLVCTEPIMTIDLLPTVAGLIGARLPAHPIDGKDIWPLIAGQPGAKSPHDALYFYWGNQLQAIRAGRWKLHLPHSYRTLAGRSGGAGGRPSDYFQARTSYALFNLEEDMGELRNIADEHPDIVERLKTAAMEFDADLQRNRRPSGRIAEP